MQGLAVASLRERKKDKVRADLLAAALDLFDRQGFSETTIPQIADTVDVSARTFLRYFPTKEDVIVSWVEEGMSVFLESLADRPETDTPQQALLTSARAVLAHYQADAEFYLKLERVIAASSTVRARKLEMTSALAEQVTALLRQRHPEAHDAMAIGLYPAMVFAMLRVVIGAWVESNGQGSLSALFNQATSLVTFAA